MKSRDGPCGLSTRWETSVTHSKVPCLLSFSRKYFIRTVVNYREDPYVAIPRSDPEEESPTLPQLPRAQDTKGPSAPGHSPSTPPASQAASQGLSHSKGCGTHRQRPPCPSQQTRLSPLRSPDASFPRDRSRCEKGDGKWQSMGHRAPSAVKVHPGFWASWPLPSAEKEDWPSSRNLPPTTIIPA